MIGIDVSFAIFITMFLLMFGCKKETPTNSNNEACSPNWSSVSDSGCLEKSNDFFIYNYYNGELDTLYYNGFYQNNILQQIRVIKRKYFGCN